MRKPRAGASSRVAEGRAPSGRASVGTGRALGPLSEGTPFTVRWQFGWNIHVHGRCEVGRCFTGRHRANVGGSVNHDGHREEETGPLDEAGFHGQVAGTKLIASTNEVLQASVGVAGSGLDPLHRQTQGSSIRQRLLVSGRGGPFGLGKLGVTVHAQRGLRESLLKRNRLSNWMA